MTEIFPEKKQENLYKANWDLLDRRLNTEQTSTDNNSSKNSNGQLFHSKANYGNNGENNTNLNNNATSSTFRTISNQLNQTSNSSVNLNRGRLGREINHFFS